MHAPRSTPGDSLRASAPDIPGAPGIPAFVLPFARDASVPVLLAVPHAGRIYPPDLLARMRAPEQACLRLEDRLVDLLAREVARATGACLLLAQAPRAMVDLNRAPDDIDREMIADTVAGGLPLTGIGKRARTGLGLVPRRLAGLGELWRERLAMPELEARIAAIHRPYHQALADTLELLRDRWGAALLIDLHSMPPLGPKHGPAAAADLVLGDRFGGACAGVLVRAGLHQLERSGRRAALNRPYAGGYVLDRHGAPMRGLHALQVEVCRATYLDADLREPGEGFFAMAADLAGLVQRLAGELALVSGGFAQAAE